MPTLPVPELIEQFRSYRHPRVPVYQGHWDNVIGFLHSEDVLKLVRGGGDLSSVTLDMILKPAHFVPPTKKVDEMFDYFQKHNTRVAIILGEYGEVFGIVTMKDVLTFIFGEISGKMVGQEYYKEHDENSYIVPGDMRLTDFYNLTNFDIEDPVMATIGGVAFRLFDRLPEPGDQLTRDGYRFVVKERSGLRISQLQVQKISSSEQSRERGREGRRFGRQPTGEARQRLAKRQQARLGMTGGGRDAARTVARRFRRRQERMMDWYPRSLTDRLFPRVEGILFRVRDRDGQLGQGQAAAPGQDR